MASQLRCSQIQLPLGSIKHCPGCDVATEKEDKESCNVMNCPICTLRWCFSCNLPCLDSSHLGSPFATHACPDSLLPLTPETKVSASAPETEISASAPGTEVSASAPETEVSDPAPETEVLAFAPETEVSASASETSVSDPAPETGVSDLASPLPNATSAS